MTRCDRCRDFLFNDKECQCTEFLIVDEDGEDHTVWALTEHGAVLAYAEKANTEGDYYLMETEVEITCDGKKYAIGAEPDIHYNITEIK